MTRIVTFPLRIPEDMKADAAEQAKLLGVSLNQYLSSAIAARLGAQAEAERYFSMRAARGSKARLREILDRVGADGDPRPDDRLDAPDD